MKDLSTMNRRQAIAGITTIGGTLAAPRWALAQDRDWPNKPVRILVASGAGGQPDAVARALADHLSRRLKQSFFVENRAGANGFIGLQAAAQAPADGYTLVWGVAAWFAINPAFYPKLPYTISDFAPVAQIGLAPHCLFVRKSLGVTTLAEFLALAKKSSKPLSYASTGNGSSSQLNMELLKQLAGIDILHVPYKSSAAAAQDFAGGVIDAFIIDFVIGEPLMQAGHVVPLAVTGPVRWPKRPDVPTFSQAGYAVEAVGWNGVFYKAGTPQAIVDRTSREIQEWARSNDGRDRLLAASLVPTGTTAAEFDTIIQRDLATWTKVVRLSGAKPD